VAYNFKLQIGEVQFSILEHCYRFFPDGWWQPNLSSFCTSVRCQDLSLVSDALQLLARRWLHHAQPIERCVNCDLPEGDELVLVPQI
jgi:hypothetical protein